MRLKNTPLAVVCEHEEAKRAALLFDTVHVALSPTHVFEHGDIRESYLQRYTDFLQPYIVSDAIDRKQSEIQLLEALTGSETDHKFVPRIKSEALIFLANTLGDKGFDAVPLYSSMEMLQGELVPRDHQIYRIILDNIPIIDPAHLDWSQVEETRKDAELRKRYRDLRLWIASIENNSTVMQISDVLEKKIELYQAALRKHGVKSALGTLSVFVDPSKLAAVSAALTSAVVFGNIEMSAVVGAIILASNCSLSIAEYCIDKEDVRSEYPEVALLHDIGHKAEA